SVGGVLGGLGVGGSDAARAFADLKSGLESPLAGMSTAFSSSLFGLAGSLVLGFLDLQAGQAQNRFYNDLEEWLSTYTRLSGGALGDGGDASVPAYIQALLEQTADSLESHQRNIEAYTARLTEDVVQGRAQSVQELRSEIRILARTIAALAEEGRR